MSDPHGNHVPDKLKALSKKPPETPMNPVDFKERVLREYERRTRFHVRTRWMRRVMTTVTVCVVVLVGVLVAEPANLETLLHRTLPNKTQSSAEYSAFKELTKQEVVEKYFDLNLQKRPTESQGLLAQKLRGKTPVFGQNRTKPHMTGYRLLSSKDVDAHFQVTLNWATYDAEAKTDTLEVTLTQEDGRWVIDDIQESQSLTYQSKDQSTLVTRRTKANEVPQTIASIQLPSAGNWGFFAADPDRPNVVAIARQATQPQIYVSEGKQALLVATLPAGEVGEMLWGENGLLVVNFSPKQDPQAQELLFVNTKTGAVSRDEWMMIQQKDLRQTHIYAVHMLPGNRLRLRFGVQSYLADLDHKTLTKEEMQPPQMEEISYDGGNHKGLPSAELAFLSAAEVDSQIGSGSTTDIPFDKRIDLSREVGYYLLNGSVQSITVGDEFDFQVEVCKDPGHVQVLRIPYTRLVGLSGKLVTLHVYDEGGLPILPVQTVQIP